MTWAGKSQDYNFKFSRVVDFKEIDRTLQNTPEKDFIVSASGRFVPEKVLIRSLKQSQSSLM